MELLPHTESAFTFPPGSKLQKLLWLVMGRPTIRTLPNGQSAFQTRRGRVFVRTGDGVFCRLPAERPRGGAARTPSARAQNVGGDVRPLLSEMGLRRNAGKAIRVWKADRAKLRT